MNQIFSIATINPRYICHLPNLKNLSGDVKPFLFYLQIQEDNEKTMKLEKVKGKIKFDSLELTFKIKKHFDHFCSYFDSIKSHDTRDWKKIVQRLLLNRREKTNCDTRTCFKFESVYIVKPYFTTGVCRVESEDIHIYHVGSRPIFLYSTNEENAKIWNLKTEIGDFVPEDCSGYNYQELDSNSIYVLPPKMIYVICTFSPAYFAVYRCKHFEEIPFQVIYIQMPENNHFESPQIPFIREKQNRETLRKNENNFSDLVKFFPPTETFSMTNAHSSECASPAQTNQVIPLFYSFPYSEITNNDVPASNTIATGQTSANNWMTQQSTTGQTIVNNWMTQQSATGQTSANNWMTQQSATVQTEQPNHPYFGYSMFDCQMQQYLAAYNYPWCLSQQYNSMPFDYQWVQPNFQSFNSAIFNRQVTESILPDIDIPLEEPNYFIPISSVPTSNGMRITISPVSPASSVSQISGFEPSDQSEVIRWNPHLCDGLHDVTDEEPLDLRIHCKTPIANEFKKKTVNTATQTEQIEFVENDSQLIIDFDNPIENNSYEFLTENGTKMDILAEVAEKAFSEYF